MFKSVLVVVLLLSSSLALAADEPKKFSEEEFLASLHFQDGKIALPGNMATLDLSREFHYLPPDDAERVLVTGWGNPPGTKSLGLIVPAAVSLLDDAGWAVVVTYDKDGHVNDDDASKIDFDDLLKEMQEGVVKANEERKKQGYPAMQLVGWAERPSYSAETHKLYWAKELQTSAPEHTLNYNVRVLGREGVLVLNAVAGMSQIGTVREEMKKVTAFTEFTAGNRYTDFNASTDKTAEYGIAALVAGGVAAKLGLFGKLFAVLLAFKKLFVLGVLAAAGYVAKLFGGRGKEVPKTDAPTVGEAKVDELKVGEDQ